MVAYTAPDCLPYLESGDSLCLNTGTVCDPSTVWCDFASAVEAKLVAFDDVVARTATSVPIAWVETLTPFTDTVNLINEPVPFDTVRIDTDSMVDLSVNPSGVKINTSGLYMIFGYLLGTTNTTVGNSAELKMAIELLPNSIDYGAATINDIDHDYEQALGSVLMTPGVHMVLPIAAGQTVFASTGGGGFANDVHTITQASLGVAWLGEMP